MLAQFVSDIVKNLLIVEGLEVGAGLSVTRALGRTLALVFEEHESLPNAFWRHIIQWMGGQ